IGNLFWWKLNTPVIPDSISALHFYDIFRDGYLYYNAPLIIWIMKCMFFVFGKECFDLQIIFVNYIFFLIGLYFIYKIGTELKNKSVGNVAMILFALTPIVYINSVHYGHKDWHVMIALIPNTYCLMKLNNFTNKKWSILYGITVGLGLLIKDEFLACFFVPWLYVVINSLNEKKDKIRIINILITILIGSLISGCHYFRPDIFFKVIREPIIETFPSCLRVPTIGLSEYILSPLLFILFVIGLIYFIYKYQNQKQKKYIVLLCLFVPWTIITFMPHHKLAEYCLVFVPAMILIISFFLESIKNYFLLVITVIVCLFQYIFFLYAIDNHLFKISFNGIKYYDISVFNELSLTDKKEIEFYLKLIKIIDPHSITKREVFLDATDIDLGAFTSLANIYLPRRLNALSCYSINDNSFDIFVTSDKGLIFEPDTLGMIEGEYMWYKDAFVRTKKFKEKYIDRRLKEIEKVRNFINNNFVLIETVLHNGSLIKIYKLAK
ncbi:MAG: glycosyltransferase family 39 protein, partial [Endomicrobiaceae bacterium]|nr:glycosyltransferase family 39 protein [Endomicrobiaceae bacterium]